MWIFFIISLSTITGKVVDKTTGEPLDYVNIVIEGTDIHTITDTDGEYFISNILSGTYKIIASRIGYKSTIIKIYIPDKIEKRVDINLQELDIKIKGIEVFGTYTTSLCKILTSAQIKSNPENIDLPHILSSLPGIGTIEDFTSRITVRGGSPDENLTLIDGVEIPYPVHFGWFGGGGGVISILNNNLIKDAIFFRDYPAHYGDKLSSVIDVKTKNIVENQLNLDLNMVDMNLIMGGDINNKSTYLLSYRKSYLNIWSKEAASSAALPKYEDYFVKITYAPNMRNKIGLIALVSADQIHYKGEAYLNRYGVEIPELEIDWENSQNTKGIIWDYDFTDRLFFHTTISRNDISWNAFQKGRGKVNAWEKNPYFSSKIFYKNPSKNVFEAGIDYKPIGNYYFYVFFPDTTPTGFPMPGDTILSSTVSYALNSYFENTFYLLHGITIYSGIRYSYFDLSKDKVFSPRFQISYKISKNILLSYSCGIYHQLPNYVDLARNSNLKFEKSLHYTFGFKQWLNKKGELSIELYRKRYYNMIAPVSDTSRDVVNYATGYGKGIEISFKKSTNKNFWEELNYTYSISRINDKDGNHYSDWDQRHIVNIIGGYKFSKSFKINFKWRYASGRPYTPVLGRKQHPITGKWLPILGDVNSARYPDYHRLDVKFRYNLSMHNHNLSIYLAFWNIYNHKNILAYEWDKDYRRRDEIYQFLFMPVGGIEMNF